MGRWALGQSLTAIFLVALAATAGAETEAPGSERYTLRAELGAENIKTQEHLAELKHFLNQHFESELESGRARGQNLYDVAKGIMLKQRPWWRRLF